MRNRDRDFATVSRLRSGLFLGWRWFSRSKLIILESLFFWSRKQSPSKHWPRINSVLDWFLDLTCHTSWDVCDVDHFRLGSPDWKQIGPTPCFKWVSEHFWYNMLTYHLINLTFNINVLITRAKNCAGRDSFFWWRHPQFFENAILVARRKEHFWGFFDGFLVRWNPFKRGVLVQKNSLAFCQRCAHSVEPRK